MQMPEFNSEQRDREMTDPIQIIAVRLYLIQKTSDDRSLVLHYAALADKPIERAMELIKRELVLEIEQDHPSLGKMFPSSPSPEHSRVLEQCQERS